jgi:hypothetical protein
VQYMILIYSPNDAMDVSPEDFAESMPAWEAYGNMLRERNAFVSAAPLAPPTSATTLRVKDGKTVTLDGPFAETKEWLGGYYIVNAATLDEALEYAGKCPGLQMPNAAIEVRPVIDLG